MNITKDHLPWKPKRILWVCPECGHANAWNYQDAQRAMARLKTGVFISTGSCFDNRCGNPECQANIVNPESPINAPCYTHSED